MYWLLAWEAVEKCARRGACVLLPLWRIAATQVSGQRMRPPIRVALGPADLGEGEIRGYSVGRRNVLVAMHEGRLSALDDSCNHGGCLLSGGHREGRTVVCPCHAVGFDLVTGQNLTSPGVCGDQPVLRIEAENGRVILLEPDPGLREVP